MKRFMLMLVVALAMGCSGLKPDTEQAIRKVIADNAGHARDESLSQQTRTLGLTTHDFLWDVLYREGCIDQLPPDVRARKEGRDVPLPPKPESGGQ